MTRIICFIGVDGLMGVCTHHYNGEHEEGDCSTCDFPEKMKNHMDELSYAYWLEDYES